MSFVRSFTATCLAGAIVLAPTAGVAAPTAANSLSIVSRGGTTSVVRAASAQTDRSKLGGSIILLSLLTAAAVIGVMSITGSDPASP